MKKLSKSSWPSWIVRMEHTADTGIIVHARTLKELFARAAWGLFATICQIGSVRGRKAFSVSVDAPDREALMVRWLSELNFLHQTRHILLCRFEVQKITPFRLTAVVRGENVCSSRHNITTEVKAVTYHNLQVQRCGREWKAQVLFDV